MKRKDSIAVLGLIISITILLLGNNLVGRFFPNKNRKQGEENNRLNLSGFLKDTTFSCDGAYMLSNDSKRISSQIVRFRNVAGSVDEMFLSFEERKKDSLKTYVTKVIVELEQEILTDKVDVPALTISYKAGGQTYMLLNRDYPMDTIRTGSLHFSSNPLSEEVQRQIITNQIESLQLHSSICTAVVISDESVFGYEGSDAARFGLINKSLKCLVEKEFNK